MALPNLTDLKAHANITTATHDDELRAMLDAAVELAASIVGPLAPAAVTETHRGVSSDVIVLRKMPVSAITAVSTRHGATVTAQALADYEVDTTTGIVRAVSGARLYGDYVITYTAGADVLPAPVRLAVLVIAAHLWETQRGTSPSALALQQGDVDQVPPFGLGFAIPNRAQALLEPYRMPVVA